MPSTDTAVHHAVAAPKPNPRNNVAMFKIFQNVQYNVVQHKKYVKEMIKLYKKLDEDCFRESFKNALQYLFTFGDASANVDKVIQFVASFCTTLDDEDGFLRFIFKIIFECQCVSGQSVRYRASQLLAAVLAALGADACLDDELCDKLLESQMQRLQDARSAVRCRAALALQRLQDPPGDEVTLAYRFHMSSDPSSSVRRAVLMSIAKHKSNIKYVIDRLRDVDEGVRRAACLFLVAVPVVRLKVAQRIVILQIGLNERVPRVRRVVEEILIPSWLSCFNGNIIDLLTAIRLDNTVDAKHSQFVAGKLLESLFKRLPTSELLEWLPTDKTLRLIPAEMLNKETAWYWRHLAEHLQKIDDDETLEAILPDLVVLTGYIRAIVESPCPDESEDPVGFTTRQHVLHELATLLRVYDASDPAGRAALQALITDVLTGDYGPLDTEVTRAFVTALEMVIPEVGQRMEVVYGVLNSLRDPPEPDMPPPPPPVIDDTKAKLERARLRVSLNVAIEAQEEAVRDQNYALAAECKAKVEDIQKKLEEVLIQPAPPPPPQPIPTIREKICDSDTLNKCLVILNSALDTPHLTTITPMLKMIFDELEVEIFQNADILENALETVALYGMLDKEFAIENKAFFFANLLETEDGVLCTALKCCMDLLCVHGARVFEEDNSQNDTARSKRTTNQTNNDDDISHTIVSVSPDHNAVIDILLSIVDKAHAAPRLVIVEGLCRLLYLGLLESPSIFSLLLVMWFNPATAGEDMLRQTIGVFFQTFPSTVDGAQEQIQKATLPTLRALANAPNESPLGAIDQEVVVRFIVSLTKVNHELLDSQASLAVVLTHHLSRNPSCNEAGLICRMLSLLAPPRDVRLACELAASLRDTYTHLPDRQSQKYLTRYLGNLEATERASLNKMSTGTTDGTMQNEETISHIGRATTSLPQPLARSTHVVINETVEEEVEIDETSPTEPVSKISTELAPAESPRTSRSSSGSDHVPAVDQVEAPSDSSSGVSPVKKPKVAKGKKKKLSMTKQPSEDKPKQTKVKKVAESEKGGVKRSRSQRSLVDVERARKVIEEKAKKAQVATPLEDLDVSNVTIRKSRGLQSGSSIDTNGSGKETKKGTKKTAVKKGKKPATKPTVATRSSAGSRSSGGSGRSMFEDSADETELHTIVYENEFEQSLLNDSSELADSKRTSKGSVTIPETPDGSDASESEPEPEPVKTKGSRNGKKK